MNLDREEIVDIDDGTVLLTRIKLLKTPWGNLDIHVFHASDADRDLHDHPWAFLTLILWGGYTEIVPVRAIRRMILSGYRGYSTPPSVQVRHFRRPGSILYRPALWTHRVELPAGRKAVTLLWTWPKSREWGFYVPRGWVEHREYVAARVRARLEVAGLLG